MLVRKCPIVNYHVVGRTIDGDLRRSAIAYVKQHNSTDPQLLTHTSDGENEWETQDEQQQQEPLGGKRKRPSPSPASIWNQGSSSDKKGTKMGKAKQLFNGTSKSNPVENRKEWDWERNPVRALGDFRVNLGTLR